MELRFNQLSLVLLSGCIITILRKIGVHCTIQFHTILPDAKTKNTNLKINVYNTFCINDAFVFNVYVNIAEDIINYNPPNNISKEHAYTTSSRKIVS